MMSQRGHPKEYGGYVQLTGMNGRLSSDPALGAGRVVLYVLEQKQ
jgi:hypothetical protein